MKRVFGGALLLLAISVFAQQQSVPPYNSPPMSTPPTFPQDQHPGQRMPPDTRAPEPAQPTNAEIQQQVQEKLATEPTLQHLQLTARVNDQVIQLSGNVDNEQQHKLALRIVQSYAGERKIVDKIKVRS